MIVTNGLLKGQVLQCNRRNEGSATVSGTCEVDGQVEVRLTRRGRVVKGLGWHAAGRAKGGEFSCELRRLPVGGPYRVEFRVRDAAGRSRQTSVDEVFVGDVWFLAGQSNMQGIGWLANAPKPDPLVRCFYMRDEWGLARDPLHFMAEAVDIVHHTLSGRTERPSEEQIRRERGAAVTGVGVGVSFGREMVARTGVPQGLVACAHGGTSMAQWSPALKGQGSQSLYGAMLRRFRLLGQPIAGVLWYQGESDAACPEGYTERMRELVAATREDFDLPDLPWVVVQIGRVVGGGWVAASWNDVQEQQRRLSESIPRLDVVPAADLELDDAIHISAKAFTVLARRMASVADWLALGNRRGKGAIRLKSVSTRVIPAKKKEPAVTVVEVKYTNVVGGLSSAGRPVGFCLANTLGEPVSAFYKTILKGDTVVLHTVFPLPSLEQMSLHYGYGCDPVVNISDGRGMGLPVMGPVEIARLSGTPFILKWQVAPVPAVTSVSDVQFADVEHLANWADAVFCPLPEGPWLVMPRSLQETRQGVFVFRSSIECTEGLRARLAFGADSPFRLWFNGAEILGDSNCTNPCYPDKYEVEVALKAGANELLVAFDVRGGQGWGICARFKPVREDDGSIRDVIRL